MSDESTTFTIPGDPKKADALAAELGSIATAIEWKRAAIVYARVRVQDSVGRPPTKKVTSDHLLTPEQYALLGIHGLRSKTTVRAYYRAWDNAVAEGLAAPVNLGDTITLPDAEWNDYYAIQNAAMPTYYRPSGSATEERPSTIDVSPAGAALSMGKGSCPPRANGVREDTPEDDQRNYRNGFRSCLRSTASNLENALEFADCIDKFGSTKQERKTVDAMRTSLDAIERKLCSNWTQSPRYAERRSIVWPPNPEDK